jgi:hypothetical protein
MLEKDITSDMNYSINLPESQLKWVHPSINGQSLTVNMIEFDKYDVPLNVQFTFEQCLYEMRNRLTLNQ